MSRSTTTPPASPRAPIQAPEQIQQPEVKKPDTLWGRWSVNIFAPTSKESEDYLYQISHSKAYWHSTWLALLPAPATALYDAAASLAQGAGKTVIWFVDFNQSKEELIFDIAGTALLNFLRSGRMAFALLILAVVGRLFPQTLFDGLSYIPKTTEGEMNKLIGEQSAKLADAQTKLEAVSKSITETKKELATAQNELIDIQKNLAAEKELLAQTTGTVSTMAGSLAESQRLQTLVTTLTEQESALKVTIGELGTQLEELRGKLKSETGAAAQQITAAKLELGGVLRDITEGQEALRLLRIEYSGLAEQRDILSQHQANLTTVIPDLEAKEKAINGRLTSLKQAIEAAEAILLERQHSRDELAAAMAKLQRETKEYKTTVVDPLRREEQSLRATNYAATEQIEKAKQELLVVQRDITQEKKTLAQQQEAFEALTEQHEACKQKQAHLVEQRDYLSTNVIPELEGQGTALRELSAQLKEQQDHLRGQIKAKEKEIKDSDAILQLKGQELAALQNKIAELQKQESEFDQKVLAPLRQEEQRLNAANADSSRDFEALKKTLQETKQTVLEKEQRLRQGTTEHQQMDEKLRDLKTQFAEVSDEKEALITQIASFKRVKGEAEAEQGELANLIATQKKESKELDKQIAQARVTFEEATRSIQARQKENEELETKNLQLVKKMRANQLATEKAEQNLRGLTKRAEDAKAEAQKKIEKELAEEFEAKRALFALELKRAMDKEQAKLKPLQDQVAALQLARDQLASAPAAATASDQTSDKK